MLGLGRMHCSQIINRETVINIPYEYTAQEAVVQGKKLQKHQERETQAFIRPGGRGYGSPDGTGACCIRAIKTLNYIALQ